MGSLAIEPRYPVAKNNQFRKKLFVRIYVSSYAGSYVVVIGFGMAVTAAPPPGTGDLRQQVRSNQ